MACFKGTIHLAGWFHQAIFFTGNSILFLSSVIGNCLVIFLVWSKTALRLPTYLLMSFLALSDLLTSLFGQVLYSISATAVEGVSCTMEKAVAFVHVTSCSSSLLLLSVIARDRYLHVSKRKNYLKHTSNRFAIIASIVCYLLGMMVGTLFTFNDRNINISRTFAFAVVGSSSFIFICAKSRKIARIVKDHSRKMQATLKDSSASERNAHIRSNNFEKKVNRSIFSVIILFFVSWTPIIILMIIFTVYTILNEPIVDGYRVAIAWASTASYFNGAMNPIIYAYRCDAIGQEIRKIIAKILRRNTISPPAIELKVQKNDADTQKMMTPGQAEARAKADS